MASTDDPNAGHDDTERQVQSVTRNLRVLFRSIQGHSRKLQEACGISTAQLWALAEMQHQPGISVGELSERLSIHASTTSNMLDKLERRGLVERRRDSTDHRVVKLHISPDGQALLEQVPAPPQGELNRALRALPAARLHALEDILAELLEHMSCRDERAALQPIVDE